MSPLYASYKNDKKRVIASIALTILVVFTLHGYLTTLYTFFDPSMEGKLSESISRASAYSTGGGGGGGGNILYPLPSAKSVELFSPEEAADRLIDYDPDEIAGVLNDVKTSHVLAILDFFDLETRIEIVKEMSTGAAVDLILLMDSETASTIIAELDTTHVEIIERMATEDLNQAALHIEATVKLLIENLDEEERSEALEQLSSVLSTLNTESLVGLFIEISNLSETPSTVAYLLESMTLTNSIQTLETWIDNGDLTSIGNIFSYLRVTPLGTIYRGLSEETRETLYNHLTFETIENLPSIGEFIISALTASPTETAPGDTVTLSFDLLNNGDMADDYTVLLKIDGDNIESYTGFLNSGSSDTFTYNLTVDEPGEYNVEVNEKSATFIVLEPVVPPTPALLLITRIEIAPEEITRGEELTVFVTLVNEGELPGTEFFELKIDDTSVEIKEDTVEGRDEKTIFFNVIAEYNPGVHTASVEDTSINFSVITPPSNLPWVTIIVTLTVVASGVAYLLHQKGLIKIPQSLISLLASSIHN
jgi:hypothetical protein